MREQVRNLINIGKERGYLLADEVEHVLPAELHSTEEIDDLLSTFERIGINVYEDLSAAKAGQAAADPIVSESPAGEWNGRAPAAEEGELDLTPGMLRC
jgi:RNA polymerase primary sigma factor